MNQQHPFRMASFPGRHYSPVCALVRGAIRESYRDLEEMMAERGQGARSHHDLPAFVQWYAPELDKRCRPHVKPTSDSRAGWTRRPSK